MAATGSGANNPPEQKDGRSRNARAQARHREKRKAYIAQLEESVQRLQTALAMGSDHHSPLGSPMARVRELEHENYRLRLEVDELRRRLAAGSPGTSIRAMGHSPKSISSDEAYGANVSHSHPPSVPSTSSSLPPLDMNVSTGEKRKRNLYDEGPSTSLRTPIDVSSSRPPSIPRPTSHTATNYLMHPSPPSPPYLPSCSMNPPPHPITRPMYPQTSYTYSPGPREQYQHDQLSPEITAAEGQVRPLSSSSYSLQSVPRLSAPPSTTGPLGLQLHPTYYEPATSYQHPQTAPTTSSVYRDQKQSDDEQRPYSAPIQSQSLPSPVYPQASSASQLPQLEPDSHSTNMYQHQSQNSNGNDGGDKVATPPEWNRPNQWAFHA